MVVDLQSGEPSPKGPGVIAGAEQHHPNQNSQLTTKAGEAKNESEPVTPKHVTTSCTLNQMNGNAVAHSEPRQLHGKNAGSPSPQQPAINKFLCTMLWLCWYTLAIASAIYWVLTTVLIVPIACLATLFLALYPLRLISMRLFNQAEHSLCTMVNEHWVAAGHSMGLRVFTHGDDISRLAGKRCLLIANHLSLIDHFCLMSSLSPWSRVTGAYLWVIYEVWRKTPLGLMWTAHNNFFISGNINKGKRKEVLASFRRHLEENYWHFEHGWVVMYPEGSRLYLIRESEKRYCARNAIAPFENCAHPRVSAAYAILSTCGVGSPLAEAVTNGKDELGIEYVIDTTIAYSRGKIPYLGWAMIGVWPDGESRVCVHHRVHKVEREWCNDEESLRVWLSERYEEKDRMLANSYATGRIAQQGENSAASAKENVEEGQDNWAQEGQKVEVALKKCMLVELFWLLLFYTHYWLWLRPLVTRLFR